MMDTITVHVRIPEGTFNVTGTYTSGCAAWGGGAGEPPTNPPEDDEFEIDKVEILWLGDDDLLEKLQEAACAVCRKRR